jgi:hypothetical protein
MLVILATQEAEIGRMDHGSKPAQANSLWDSILKKNPSQKRAGEVAQGIGPEFKPQYWQKKKKKKKKKAFLGCWI